jgi:hypothetical protein
MRGEWGNHGDSIGGYCYCQRVLAFNGITAVKCCDGLCHRALNGISAVKCYDVALPESTR